MRIESEAKAREENGDPEGSFEVFEKRLADGCACVYLYGFLYGVRCGMSLGSVMEQTSLLRDWNELEDEGDHELSVLKGYRKLTRPSFEHTTSSVHVLPRFSAGVVAKPSN